MRRWTWGDGPGRTLGTLVTVAALLAVAACDPQLPGPTASSTGTAAPAPPSTQPAALALPDPATAAREVGNATLTFAPWPRAGTLGACRSEGVTFTDGWSTNVDEPYSVRVVSVTPAAIGGAPTYLVHALCHGPGDGMGQPAQLVAYRKVGGGFDQLATVVVTEAGAGAGLRGIDGVGAPEPDQVIVEVFTLLAEGSALPPGAKVSQTRSFRWTGSSFVQFDGPTSFPRS